MADISQEQEQQVKKLKRLLEGWRMALLPLKSVMLWEQQWHPLAIFGTISFLYVIIWLMDLSSIATFATIGLIINFVDFIVPIICNSIYGPSSWTGIKEQTYEDICRSIVAHYNKTLNQIYTFYSMRETSPVMLKNDIRQMAASVPSAVVDSFKYYIISISMLLTLAWVSSSFNNIFLLYLLSTMMVLWPGIQHKGTFNSLLSMIGVAPKVLKSE